VTSNLPNYDPTDLDAQIYHTQLIQSEADGNAYRSWRRGWRGPGKEYCGGALVWQLNDCWPATSWAVVDFNLNPKMAFWAIKRESALLTVGIHRSHESMEVWAVNMMTTARVVDVVVRTWDVISGAVLSDVVLHRSIKLGANQSTELGTVVLPTGPLLGANVVAAAYILEKGHQLARCVNFHEPLKDVPFQPGSVLYKIGKTELGERFLELSSQLPIKGLLIRAHGQNYEGVSFDDNGVDLVPGESLRLGVEGLDIGEESRLALTWLGSSKSNSISSGN
jgi:beta-mannosidase